MDDLLSYLVILRFIKTFPIQLGVNDHHQTFPVGHHLSELRRIRRRGLHRRLSSDAGNAESRRNNDSR